MKLPRLWPLYFVVPGLVACAALVHDAQVAEPGITAGCSLLKVSPAPAWVDVACYAVQEADDLIAHYPTARKVSENTITAPDGGVSVTIVVRIPVVVAAGVVTDGGTDR